MGVELQKVVAYVNARTQGVAAVDLARLNLRVGRAISRQALSLPDDPELLDRAWRCAREIVGESLGGGMA